MSKPVHLTLTLRVSSLAAALTTVTGMGEAHALVSFNCYEINGPETALGCATIAGAPGKSESAAPAAAPVAAKKKGAASAKASDTAAQQPSPSTGETSQPTDDTKPADEPAKTEAKKLPAYADTDLPARIMEIVKTSKTTGDKSQVNKLIAALAEFGVKSAKDLTPEQVVDFTPKLAAIEAPTEDDSDIG